MKGCDFVKKAVFGSAKSHPLVCNNSFVAAEILLVLTLISIRMVCGLYAKYTVSDGSQESAKVAASPGIHLEEVAVELYDEPADMTAADTIYAFGSGTAEGFSYAVIPGMDLPKDPRISVSGKDRTSCYLYLEVIQEQVPATVTFSLEEVWEPLTDVTGPHGGDVYCYETIIQPDDTYDSIGIIRDQKIYVSQAYTAGDPFSIAFCGYMIQKEGDCTAAELFRNHMKEGV